MKFKQWLPYLFITCIVLVFFFLRIKPLISQEVIYSYDQARDFLAGARIIINKDLVFIGPTTGIGGLFHGAWWYYIVAATFLLFGPNPTNYYYVILFTQFASLLLFFFVARKLIGDNLALLGSLNIAVGNYYISTSAFPSNHIFAMPSFLSYCLILGLTLKRQESTKKISVLFFLLGLSLGFVAEFELAFGLLLVPTTILLAIFHPTIRKLLFRSSSFLFFLSGLLIPFMPRLLFEVKNHFVQTQLLLNFIIKPKLYTPKPYSEAFRERIANFSSYIPNTFANNVFFILTAIFVLFAVVILINKLYLKLRNKTNNDSLLDFSYNYAFTLFGILTALFVISIGYRDTFWHYYFEGIHYGILILGLVCVKISVDHLPKCKKIVYGIILGCLIFTFGKNANAVLTENSKAESGLYLQRKIVQYIVDKQKDEKIFCARTYVPPVIPYTYDYLWLYHYLKKDVETPRFEFIYNKCWYIIEPDQNGFEFRPEGWKKSNIPDKNKEVTGSRKSFNGIEVFQLEQTQK